MQASDVIVKPEAYAEATIKRELVSISREIERTSKELDGARAVVMQAQEHLSHLHEIDRELRSALNLFDRVK